VKDGNVIEVIDVKKKFKVYYDKGRSLKEKVLFLNRNKYETRWVLNGISFEVKKGEAIGLIGQNGCGKSTTLKLLTRIMYPDEGIINIKGRVSSLIELGAGFHPDMSGRENIYTNASIFGLTKKEIDERIKDIIEFSELEDFLDNPVRTYSSGMYMRLAFSVAINVDADVLLIDEILAVGDANFQVKCFNKLREIKAKGTTIVIVSHSLAQIEQICDRSIWIHDGLIEREGNPRDVHITYMDFMGQKRNEAAKIEDKREGEEGKNAESVDIDGKSQRWGNGDVRIKKISTYDKQLLTKNVFNTGDDIIVKIEYTVIKSIKNVVFGIGIFRSDGLQCYGTNTWIDNMKKYDLDEDGIYEICLSDVNLLPGEYNIDLIIEGDTGAPVDYYKVAHKIQVYSALNDTGIIRINHKWIFK
jgi:ABC-type polysaccharide/polyol phosphate transport system, ATPase component